MEANFHYRSHIILPLIIILTQPNPIHILTYNFPRTYFSFIKPSITTSPKLSFFFTLDTIHVALLHPRCVIVTYNFPLITVTTGQPAWRAARGTALCSLSFRCFLAYRPKYYTKFVPKQPESSA